MEYSKRDDEICRLLSAGNPKGMDLLFDTYYRRLVVWADTFLKDIQLAEGVVQEFFIVLWEKRKQKELTAPFLTSFLYVSVKNRCLKKIEKQDVFHNTTDLQEVHLAFEEYDEKHDRILTQVLQEMENLPPRSRLIMEGVFIHGMKYREVAEKYDVSVSTVKTLLGNAVRKLRERLNKEQFAGFLFFFCKQKSACHVNGTSKPVKDR